jgi:predicted enzyme related to lactoylglutathione lyase
MSVEVENVDELVPRVAQLGGRLLGLPNDMPWGQRVAHIEDPDGNAVNLTQPIPPTG